MKWPHDTNSSALRGLTCSFSADTVFGSDAKVTLSAAPRVLIRAQPSWHIQNQCESELSQVGSYSSSVYFWDVALPLLPAHHDKTSALPRVIHKLGSACRAMDSHDLTSLTHCFMSGTRSSPGASQGGLSRASAALRPNHRASLRVAVSPFCFWRKDKATQIGHDLRVMRKTSRKHRG